MAKDIIVTLTKFARHRRRDQKRVAAGRTIPLKSHGEVFAAVRPTERVLVDAELLDQVRQALEELDPELNRELNDRQVIESALQRSPHTPRSPTQASAMARIVARTFDVP